MCVRSKERAKLLFWQVLLHEVQGIHLYEWQYNVFILLPSAKIDVYSCIKYYYLSAGIGLSKTKLLEQPIPASYLKLEERVRQLAVQCKEENNPPVIKETVFRDNTKDIIANARELNQAVTFLHENGM